MAHQKAKVPNGTSEKANVLRQPMGLEHDATPADRPERPPAIQFRVPETPSRDPNASKLKHSPHPPSGPVIRPARQNLARSAEPRVDVQKDNTILKAENEHRGRDSLKSLTTSSEDDGPPIASVSALELSDRPGRRHTVGTRGHLKIPSAYEDGPSRGAINPGDPGKKRSLSFSENQNSPVVVEWLEERLLTEKRQCDFELRIFISTVLDPMEREVVDTKFEHARKKLSKSVTKMLGASVDDLRDGRCRKLTDRIQRIQLNWKPDWPQKANITRLLLVIGRVARIIDQLDYTPDPYDDGKKNSPGRVPRENSREPKSGPPHLATYIATKTLLAKAATSTVIGQPPIAASSSTPLPGNSPSSPPTVSGPPSSPPPATSPSAPLNASHSTVQARIPSGTGLNASPDRGQKNAIGVLSFLKTKLDKWRVSRERKKEKEKENDKSKLEKLAKEGSSGSDSTPNSSTTPEKPLAVENNNPPRATSSSLATSALSSSSPGSSDVEEVGGEQLLCRICEELVPQSLLEEHSRFCAASAQAELKAQTCNERLQKIVAAIDKQLEENKPAPGASKQTNPDYWSMTDIDALRNIRGVIAHAIGVDITTLDAGSNLEELKKQISELMEMVAENSPAYIVASPLGERAQSFISEKCSAFYDIINAASPQLLKREIAQKEKRLSLDISSSQKKTSSIRDFEILKPISKGAFGKVFLARKVKTGDIYAIKVLSKSKINSTQLEHIRAERNILAATDNPFVVRLFYTFQSEDYLYLVMEFLPGGDLHALLKALNCFTEAMARQYAAEVVLALEYLHTRGIVHRDLKSPLSGSQIFLPNAANTTTSVSPTNSSSLAGASTSVENSSSIPLSPQTSVDIKTKGKQRFSLVGTPDYLAPEVLLGKGHGTPVDWWALGSILYEFLTGIPPFNDETPQKIFENILNRSVMWPRVPEEMSEEAYDLIDRLLTVDPTKRLGYNGAEEVKKHPFFKSIEWSTVLEQPAVWVPQIADITDLSFFDPARQGSFEFPQAGDDNTPPQNNQKLSKKHFLGFSYKSLPALEALNKETIEGSNKERRNSVSKPL